MSRRLRGYEDMPSIWRQDAQSFRNWQREEYEGDEGRLNGRLPAKDERVKKALRMIIQCELTDKEREALELVYMKGMSQAEAAEFLGITRGPMSRRLSKAKDVIAKYMKYVFLDM